MELPKGSDRAGDGRGHELATGRDDLAAFVVLLVDVFAATVKIGRRQYADVYEGQDPGAHEGGGRRQPREGAHDGIIVGLRR